MLVGGPGWDWVDLIWLSVVVQYMISAVFVKVEKVLIFGSLCGYKKKLLFGAQKASELRQF